MEETKVKQILEIRKMIKERDEARLKGDFGKSDLMRQQLESKFPIKVKDQKGGPSGWKFIDGSATKIDPALLKDVSVPKTTGKRKQANEDVDETPVAPTKKAKKESTNQTVVDKKKSNETPAVSQVADEKPKKSAPKKAEAVVAESQPVTKKAKKANNSSSAEETTAPSKDNAVTPKKVAANKSTTTPSSSDAKAAKSVVKAEVSRNKAILDSVVGPIDPNVKTVNGVVIEELEVGSGAESARGKTIKVHYVGKLKSNGKIFDQSNKKPFSFRLGAGEVIRGWDIGCDKWRVGGKRRLTIPPEKAYGKAGAPPTIPSNATLVFDVTLVEVR